MEGNAEKQLTDLQQARLHLTTSAIFDTFDRYETQECLATSQYHWMLSEEFKIPTEPPSGLINTMTPLKSDHAWILIPEEPGLEKLDFKVVHQILRELTVGIYLLNQTPSINLASNFDCSTSVQLPPAYIDTKVGQLLTNVDYMMKCMWHGSFLPRDKRQKFADRWRKKLDVSPETGEPQSKTPHIMDFHGAGMIDITKIKEYSSIYEAVHAEQPGDAEKLESKKFFMDHTDDLTMKMNIFQKSLQQHRNLFLVDGEWTVSSIVKLTEDKIDNYGYERLQSRLRIHQDIISQNLDTKDDIRMQLSLLKLVSFLVPFLCATRRKMQIPDISMLLPPLLGDHVKTERELPPLMLGADYACKNFAYKDQMFSLHGGILVDLETPVPVSLPDEFVRQYEKIVSKASPANEKALDVEAPVQEHYEMPVVEANGKRYYALKVELDSYYPQNPKKPKWLQSVVSNIESLKPKRLPVQDGHMMDVYKKLFGQEKAQDFKVGKTVKEKQLSNEMNVQVGLRAAAKRGLVAIFSELARKSQMSQLMKQDDKGLGLIHHAALNNNPQIIAVLILKSMDVNVRRNQSVLSIGGVGNQLLDGDEGSTPNRSRDGPHLDDMVLDESPRADSSSDSLSGDEDPSKPAPRLSSEYYRPRIVNQGPTAMHVAARCGALDAVSCLIANYANSMVMDQNGWAPIHMAAYYNHINIIKLLVRKHDSLLELVTQNEVKNTPMLLAANSGALESVICLLNLGADLLRTNERGYNLIHLAALRFHTNILEYFINKPHDGIKVWTFLVEMLKSADFTLQDASVRCMEMLTLAHKDHWKSIRDFGGIPALVNLLKSERPDIQSVTASVLCNLSEEDDIRRGLAKCNASKILIDLLSSPVDDIQSRAAIILSDVACVGSNQIEIAELGAVGPLISLLDSELEDVLVNSVNAIRVLCTTNAPNQSEVANRGATEPLVEFLSATDSEILQAAACAALAALCTEHEDNQNLVREHDAVKPLVKLTESRNMTVQVKSSSAIVALCTDNPVNQQAFLELNAPKYLIKLLKIWSIVVKEQGACALWAIAGHTKPQQKMIAERIGTTQIIDMLLLKSEQLQFVGCNAMIALCRENIEQQNRICNEGGIDPLVRLVKSPKSSQRVLVTGIKTLGILCVGVAHRNNTKTQTKIAECNAIPILVGLLLSPPTQEIQVEVAVSLACIVLSNFRNQEKLKEIPSFNYSTLLNLLKVKSQNIRLQAGEALAIFGFNNTPQQYAMRQAGGISFSMFETFILSENEFYRASAAFQVVVLARVITDRDQVSLTAQGVTMLVHLLNSQQDNVKILSASLLSSLAHTRAGIPDAMITSGAIDSLINNLSSPYNLVRTSCAVALGYLTFNKTAARQLLSSCRMTPGLYENLMENIDADAKISDEFKQDFAIAKKIGLPSQSLEKNGGPPACPPKREASARPKTTAGRRSVKSRIGTAASVRPKIPIRAVSAPAQKSRSTHIL